MDASFLRHPQAAGCGYLLPAPKLLRHYRCALLYKDLPCALNRSSKPARDTAMRTPGVLRWFLYLAPNPTKPVKNMTYQTTRALFLFVLLALAPLRMAVAQNQYEQQVLQQLESASMVFTSAGYTPVIGDGDKLDHQASETYTVTLKAGRSYVLMGVCDEDCLDLDLELYDGSGNLISQDNTEDDAPIVEVNVATGGDFTLKVTMYECNNNPCYYGVGLYGESQNQYEQQVSQQLGEVSTVFTSAGLTPILRDGGHLGHRTYEDYAVTLVTGHSYVLMGVCDEDCQDLDLELYDGYGNLISQDDSVDDAPVVEVSVVQGGAFTLRVMMYECTEDPCYYGFGVFGN